MLAVAPHRAYNLSMVPLLIAFFTGFICGMLVYAFLLNYLFLSD